MGVHNDAHSLIISQSPYFHKQGLCDMKYLRSHSVAASCALLRNRPAADEASHQVEAKCEDSSGGIEEIAKRI